MTTFFPHSDLGRAADTVLKIKDLKIPTLGVKTSSLTTATNARADRILSDEAAQKLDLASKIERDTLLKDMTPEQLEEHAKIAQSIIQAGWAAITTKYQGNKILASNMADVRLKIFQGGRTDPNHSTIEGPVFEYGGRKGVIHLDPQYYAHFHRYGETAKGMVPLFLQGIESATEVLCSTGIRSYVKEVKHELSKFPKRKEKLDTAFGIQKCYLFGVALHHANKVKQFISEDEVKSTAIDTVNIIIDKSKILYGTDMGDNKQYIDAILQGFTTGDLNFGLKMIHRDFVIDQVLRADEDEPLKML